MDTDSTADRASIVTASTAWLRVPDASIPTLHVAFSTGLDEDGTTLSIRRALIDADGACFAEIVDWSSTSPDAEQGSARAAAMIKLSTSPALLVGTLRLVGPERFGAKLEALTAEAVARQEEQRAEALEKAKADEALACQIEVYFRGTKNPRLELQRGNRDEAFWSVSFSEPWERERFWDWLKWQRDRFGAFAELHEANGGNMLKSMLLREMAEAERAVRKNGLASTGRRPLRFWSGDLA